MATGDETGNGGISQAGECGDIEVNHFHHRIDIGLEQRRDPAEAGIVDENLDGRVLTQTVLDQAPVGGIGQVGAKDLHLPAGRGGDLAGNRVQAFRVTGHQDEVEATTRQAFRVNRPDAR